MKSHIIKDLWESFAVAVIPPDAPETQYTEMRRAFYAGVVGMFSTLQVGADTLSKNDAMVMILAIKRELIRFSQDVSPRPDSLLVGLRQVRRNACR